jgi:hypothetical protein
MSTENRDRDEHARCNDCGAIDNDDTGICHAEDCLGGNLAVQVPSRDCDCGAKPDYPHTHGGPSQEAKR